MRHDKKKRSSNTDRLSQGKKIAAQKKKWKEMRTESCTFDSEARAEYLTGFHKRKVERRNKALQKTKEEERTSKLAMRADLRAQRKAELEQRMQAYRAELGLEEEDDDEEWHGFTTDDKTKKSLWAVNEYEDDEKTVSVQVEEM